MQTCYNCGKVVDDNVLICPDCGALVKRYDAPVREPAEPAPEPYPAASAPGQKPAIFADETGRLRFRTMVKVWMILGIVYALYSAFSFGCALLVYQNPETFLLPLQQTPELAPLVEMMQTVLDAVSHAYVLFLLYPICFAVKGCAAIWFLCSKRKTAFYVSAGAAAVLVLLTLTTGTLFGAVLNGLDLLIVGLLLKPNWNMLK